MSTNQTKTNPLQKRCGGVYSDVYVVVLDPVKGVVVYIVIHCVILRIRDPLVVLSYSGELLTHNQHHQVGRSCVWFIMIMIHVMYVVCAQCV